MSTLTCNRPKLYDKRDDFNFPIVNFPFICSNIPASPTYGVHISQLIRYSSVCGSYHDLFDRELLLTRKLLNQGFLLVKLKSPLRTFYGRHHDLVDCYGISLSQMTTDMFHLSLALPGPFLRVCNYINTSCATSGAGTAHPFGAPEFTPGFSWSSCYSIFSFICMFCRTLFIFLYFFFWPLCYMFFFDIRILIAPLISSTLL